MPGPATSASSEPAGSGPAGSGPIGLGLITWDDDSPTGGNIYNAALVAELRSIGVDADLVRVGAGWPEGTAADRARLGAALVERPLSLVDGIVAGNAPDELRAAVGSGARVSVLVHLPLADDPGLPAAIVQSHLARQRRALAVATAVICPSRYAADRLALRYARPDAVVARPGTAPAAIAEGSSPPRLLCLGALTPTKNQLGFVDALHEVRGLSWTALIVGSSTAAPDYAAEVARAARALDDRVRVTGTVVGSALDEIWAGTDLLVLCSRVETYGLVVAEALARGIPTIVPAGTGAVEALGDIGGLTPGSAVHPDELAVVLRDWLTRRELRADWRRLALARRATLPTWRGAAEIVRAATLDQI